MYGLTNATGGGYTSAGLEVGLSFDVADESEAGAWCGGGGCG